MTRTFDSHRLVGIGLCALLLTACGEEEKSEYKGTLNPQQTGANVDSGAQGNPDGGQEPDAPPVDPNEFPDTPEVDGGKGEDGPDATTNQPESDAGEPEATPGTLLDLPHDGERTSACYGVDDCNGDDLLCFATAGTAPGFCTEDCKEDTDCKPIDGLTASCSPEGRCQVDCAGTGEGDGKCPENMECRDLPNPMGPGIVTPVVIDALTPNWRCVYPVDAGSNDVKLYGKCERAHGNGDCEGVLGCHAPTGGLSAATGPGYCTGACTAATDCTLPNGTTSLPLCVSGACDFDCSASGATCPQGMNCRDVDNSLLDESFRCRFID
jgi:hypothetical protein